MNRSERPWRMPARSATEITPLLSGARPTMLRPRLVFPHPDSPTKPNEPRAGIKSETPSTARTPPPGAPSHCGDTPRPRPANRALAHVAQRRGTAAGLPTRPFSARSISAFREPAPGLAPVRELEAGRSDFRAAVVGVFASWVEGATTRKSPRIRWPTAYRLDDRPSIVGTEAISALV